MRRRRRSGPRRPRRRRTAAAILAPAAVAALLAAGDPAAAFADNGEAQATAAARQAQPPAAHQLIAEAQHPDPERRVRLASALPEVLSAMSDLERARFVRDWATSTSGRLRLAIARALRYAPDTPGCITAIEHLAGDRDAAVRVAIAEAAWLRRREQPRRLIAVLHRLADDAHPFVREVARLALGDA
ncbi:MAG TPA: HEAT repeat domain-containing protein [Kofleriaceae bacterium]|nr:HEAT repeat domain-containing protein [Kofleriaceae bacterium]